MVLIFPEWFDKSTKLFQQTSKEGEGNKQINLGITLKIVSLLLILLSPAVSRMNQGPQFRSAC